MAEPWEAGTAPGARRAGRRPGQEEAAPGRKLEDFVLDCLAWAFVAWMAFAAIDVLFP